MTIVKFCVPYDKKLSRSDVDALIQATGKSESELVDKDLGEGLYEIHHWKELEADVERLVAIPKFEFEVKVGDNMPGTSYLFLLRYLDTVNAKLDKCLHEIGTQRPSQQFNDRVSVHVANNALMRVDETKVLEDCCTEDLQGWLDDGWRILAICPQPDQRRPDYILGRVKPTVEV
jgi:hypothetical protein